MAKDVMPTLVIRIIQVGIVFQMQIGPDIFHQLNQIKTEEECISLIQTHRQAGLQRQDLWVQIAKRRIGSKSGP